MDRSLHQRVKLYLFIIKYTDPTHEHWQYFRLAVPSPVALCVPRLAPLPACPGAAAGSRPGWPSGAPAWRRAARPPRAGRPQLPAHPGAAGRAPTG